MTDDAVKVRPIKITEKAYKKMTYYSKIMGIDEVGGMLVIGDDEENKRLVIEDVLLFKQTVNSGKVSLDKEVIHQFMTDMIMEGKEELIKKVRGWWHSHGQGGVFWSGTDEATIKRWTYRGDYFVSVNTNADGEVLVRVDTNRPFDMTINKYPYELDKEEDPMFEVCKTELIEKVTKEEIPTYKSGMIWDKQQGLWTYPHGQENLDKYKFNKHGKKNKYRNHGEELEAEVLTDEQIDKMSDQELCEFIERNQRKKSSYRDDYPNGRRWSDRYDWD